MIPGLRLKYEIMVQHGAPYQSSPSYQSFPIKKVKERTKIDIERELKSIIDEIESGKILSLILTEKGLLDKHLMQIVEAVCKPRSNVVSIDVSNNRITSIGIRDIWLTLSNNSSITTLNFAYNKIDNEGVGFFLEMLKQNFTVTCINLFKNSVDDNHLSKLQYYLERNAEFQREKAKPYPVVISELGNHFSTAPLVKLILSYYNELEDPDARRQVEMRYYPPNITNSNEPILNSESIPTTRDDRKSEDETALQIDERSPLFSRLAEVQVDLTNKERLDLVVESPVLRFTSSEQSSEDKASINQLSKSKCFLNFCTVL